MHNILIYISNIILENTKAPYILFYQLYMNNEYIELIIEWEYIEKLEIY